MCVGVLLCVCGVCDCVYVFVFLCGNVGRHMCVFVCGCMYVCMKCFVCVRVCVVNFCVVCEWL